jgi:hypothetical protein
VIAVTLAETSPTPKDTVIAILGASSALAGLVLIFLGLIASSLQAAVRELDQSKPTWKTSWSNMGKIGRITSWMLVFFLVSPVFALTMISIGLSLAWLAIPAGRLVYDIDIWVFAAELLLIAALGAVILSALHSDVVSHFET